MKRNLSWLVAAAVALTAAAGWAGDDWTKVGTFTVSKKNSREVTVNRTVSTIKLQCTDGKVVVNTIVVRQGEQKTPHTVGKRLEAGQSVEVEIGDKVNVTGLRISEDVRGTYELYVR